MLGGSRSQAKNSLPEPAPAEPCSLALFSLKQAYEKRVIEPVLPKSSVRYRLACGAKISAPRWGSGGGAEPCENSVQASGQAQMKGRARPGVWRPWPWRLCSVFIFISAMGSSCVADDVILHLQNGDRITGRIILADTNQIVVATAFSGKLTIPRSLVEKQEPAPQGGASNAPPSLVRATGVVSELVLTNKAAGTQTTNSSGFRQFLREWHGEAQMGANLGFSTVDREAFTGHMKLTENHKFAGTDRSLRNIIDYDVAYGKTDGVLSDNRMDGSIMTECDLSKRFLVYNSAVAGYDEIRTIDLQYDVGPGIGYKWVIQTNFVFKTEFGADYQEQYFKDQTPTSRYALRLDEDAWWQITRKVRWDEKVEFFPELDNLSEYRVRLETNLSYLFKQNITFSLNVIDQYDTGLPANVSKNDLQIRTLLGIKF
jgi:putative salt-induced outer membrane protein YdiY